MSEPDDEGITLWDILLFLAILVGIIVRKRQRERDEE